MRHVHPLNAFGAILFAAFITALHPLAVGQPRGPMGDIFQGQTPPPGAISVITRSFLEAGETGFGNSLTLLIAANEPRLQQELGLTDTELGSIRLVQTQMLMNAPQYAAKFNSMTPETQKNVQEELVRDLGRITEGLNRALPKERQENVQKFVFQATGGIDSPLANLSALEVLNLSDDQRTKLQGVFDEMREERMAPVERMLAMGEKIIAAGGPDNLSPEDREEFERLNRSGQSEFETLMANITQKLSERLRQHLTPEQLELADQLMASRPGFLPPLPPFMQARGNQNDAGGAGAGYTPGANSWRPGMELPVEVQRPQGGGFPRPGQ